MHELGIAEELVGKKQAKRVRFEEALCGRVKGLHLFEVSDPIADATILANEQEWQDVEFEAARDFGSQNHICDELDCPGYTTEPSPGDR